MKKTLFFLFPVFLLGVFLNAGAQREVTIEGYPITGGGDITAFVDAISTALDADAANRDTDPNVVYILKRDHLYPNTKTIKNNFFLQMKANDGDGARPVILTWEDSEGKYQRILQAAADVYFENIEFDNKTPNGVEKARSQRLNANGIRGEFVGCLVYGDDGGAFNIYADNCKIFLRDCTVQNCGTENAYDSNGRFLDVRADNSADSVVFVNCTGHHLNGSLVRSGNAVINYLKIDHVTCFNNRGGNVQGAYAKEAIITNNLFKDSWMSGDIPSQNDPAETNPDLFHDCVIEFDTIWDPTKITIRNNNIFNSAAVKAMWDKYDTIFEPLAVNPMAMRALGDDSVHAYFSEVINFKQVCDPPIAYMEAFIMDATATVYPSQHCKGAPDGGYFPDQIDATYETSSASYTAGDDGFPLGDLNWWPALKTKWENGEVVSDGLKSRVTDLVKVYPNPAKDQLNFSISDHRWTNIVLYDITGREVQSIISNGGDIEVNVSKLPKAMYIYRVADINGNTIQSGKVMIAK